MQRFMAGAATGDQGDLAFGRGFGTGHEGRLMADRDQIAVGSAKAIEGFGQDRIDVVYEFFHGLSSLKPAVAALLLCS